MFFFSDFFSLFSQVDTTQKVKQNKQHSSQKQLIRNRSRSEIVENKPLPEITEKQSRYPKRGTRKCYREQEVPDEDHFLCKIILNFL